MCIETIDTLVNFGGLIVSVWLAVVTIKVSKSADLSSKRALEISQTMKELEIKHEAPFVYLVSENPLEPNRIPFVPTGSDKVPKVFLYNYGNSAATNVSIEINFKGILYKMTLSRQSEIAIAGGSFFPRTQSGNIEYTKGSYLHSNESTDSSISLPFTVEQNDVLVCVLNYNSVFGEIIKTSAELHAEVGALVIRNQKVEIIHQSTI